VGTSSELVAVLNRACNDCHSNVTVWPWYTEIAPLSWLMAYGVKEGRKAVNFSEWAAYPPEGQRILLAESCQDEGRQDARRPRTAASGDATGQRHRDNLAARRPKASRSFPMTTHCNTREMEEKPWPT
jgi:hypothetical protein